MRCSRCGEFRSRHRVVRTTLQGIEIAVRDGFGRVAAIENCQSVSGADNLERLCKRIWVEQYHPVRYMAFASSNNLIFFSTS